MDGIPIHIIKIKVVQVGGRHLRVSFLFLNIRVINACYNFNRNSLLCNEIEIPNQQPTVTEIQWAFLLFLHLL
ncbi:hypothetical protein FML83_14640 [Bacillus thuringiensis]|uniref:Uncharacterized protein n=1 Tax=Bacillus thuringiensis TaxID=1428 RepID=A0AAP4Q7R7_BACTU|nr:hypothetical protein [Bacillus thuringiensis]MDN7079286.1 hypothetical protein [Bacillus thuringiensis]MDQ7255976.1 hypothetical protein [Bacillus thuringiensis]MDR5028400.1 hypothetical protein [Bacillus thuringiensis]MDV6351612.1 hypothetical protein [Bacillus thuringiensis]